MAQADVDDGKREGAVVCRSGRADPPAGGRTGVLAMENEIWKRAAAYFARENILPK
jgi:transposase